MDENNFNPYRTIVVDEHEENTSVEETVKVTTQVSEIRVPENIPIRVRHPFPRKHVYHVYEETQVEHKTTHRSGQDYVTNTRTLKIGQIKKSKNSKSHSNGSLVDLDKLDELLKYQSQQKARKRYTKIERSLFFILVFFVIFDLILFLSYVVLTSNSLAFGQ